MDDHDERYGTCGAAARHGRRCAALKRFVCRLDVCWTFFFFLFLVVVFTITSAVTRTKVGEAMLTTWHLLHATRITAINRRIGKDFDRFFAVARGFLTLHTKTRVRPDVEEVMSTLCSLLHAYDTYHVIASVTAATFRINAMTACVRDDTHDSPNRTGLLGYASVNSVIEGVYYVNNATYHFNQPPQLAFRPPPSLANVTATLAKLSKSDPVFSAAKSFYNGSATTFDTSLMWTRKAHLPNVLWLTYPTTLLYTINTVPADKDVELFAKLAIDITTLLKPAHTQFDFNVTTAIFADATLADDDPSIVACSWEQEFLTSPSMDELNKNASYKYFPVSTISNPLMRAALKHVNLKALQQSQHAHSADFIYDGAPATVTATIFQKDGCPGLPIVYVTAQSAITPPYTRIMNICNGVACVVIVAVTAIFWCCIHRCLSTPLEGVTALLEGSAQAGIRSRRDVRLVDDCFQLSEVRTLMQVSSDAVARLRHIDTFIPEARLHQLQFPHSRLQGCGEGSSSKLTSSTRSMCASFNDLTEQIMTVVYLRIRRVPRSRASRKGQRDVPVATRANAQSVTTAMRLSEAEELRSEDSGPFTSPASLADFVTAVSTLCRIHRGAVHRIAPDTCILHFGRAVRTHFFSYAAAAAAAAVAASRNGSALAPEDQLNAACVRRDSARCARQDARDALHFTLNLQQWLDQYKAAALPDVRALVDTGRFTCGQYRPCGSEQTLSVAFGRDVSRELGHVPASIGVRIAMTEEVAGRVRAGVQRSKLTTIDSGVRQLPVEALRTGRVGLDADVVILYEVLPGNVVGNAAWQLYRRCCFDAFGLMLHGEYAAALSAFRAVMDISDLDPGLMPSSLRREAAATSVCGGAVLTQVERLMKECERRMAAGITRGYYRERIVPLGVDAVLKGGVSPPWAPRPEPTTGPAESDASTRLFASATTAVYREAGSRVCGPSGPAAATRAEEPLQTAPAARLTVDPLQCSLPDQPGSFTDSLDMRWYLPLHADTVFYARKAPTATTATATVVLGSAGALCTLRCHVFPHNALPILNEVEDAPLDLLPDDVADVVPTSVVVAKQREYATQLFHTYQKLQHPNIMTPLAYAFPTEDTMAAVWNLFVGGTLRELYARFPRVRLATVVCFNASVLAALMHLHDNDVVHGAVSLDNVVASTSGHCRLMLHSCSLVGGNTLFARPRTCYVSPAMAAGHAPTKECDMFCYGLMCVEAATRRPPWAWAPAAEAAGQPQHTEEELVALMREGGPAFNAAVVDGRVVPNTKLLNVELGQVECDRAVREAMRLLLSYDPAARLTAAEMWEVTRRMFVKADVTSPHAAPTPVK
jgi:hypothetical protein